MAGVPRQALPDGFFHVTCRAVDGATVFRADVDRLDFLDVLARAVDRHGIRVIARCLMDTHYHLVVETTTEKLSLAMQYLNSVYARRFNKRHDRRGHVFSERFSSWVIRDEEHLHAALDYVANNPAKAGQNARHNERWSLIDADQLRR